MLVTTALIVLSAIFVIMEFSLLGARRHRLDVVGHEVLATRRRLR
ncbi:hypothetical protein [Micrococcus luteus]|nr:hypothetical protein [Micrococcus luteus]